MKLIVQIPCLNEAATLPATMADIPRQIDGIDKVEILVIDDGSSDGTAAIAREHGADHVVRFARNRGLGHAFSAGFDTCVSLGADIIVNTDGDNQYNGADVSTLVRPILEGRADIVIGDRQTGGIAHFSFVKRFLQKLGSSVVGRLAGLRVADVASGFRAYSREAALQLSTFTDFDHTAEHVVQAGQDRLAVVSVPVGTNPKARESRLFSNVGQFVVRSGTISLRTYARYKALKIFASFGAVTFLVGRRYRPALPLLLLDRRPGRPICTVADPGVHSTAGWLPDVPHRHRRRPDSHQPQPSGRRPRPGQENRTVVQPPRPAGRLRRLSGDPAPPYHTHP